MVAMRSRITPEQLAVLKRRAKKTLCLWYCMINCWEWPEELPGDPCPGIKSSDERFRRLLVDQRRATTDILDWIEERVGEKTVSKYWNTEYYKHMTPSQFETWWKEEKRREKEEKKKEASA